MFLRTFAALTRITLAAAVLSAMAIGGGAAQAEKYAAIVIDVHSLQLLRALRCQRSLPSSSIVPLY